MSFDVPKVVRRPGCDHGHDEESLNGRDINIDILEAYVWTSKWFRVSSGIYRSTGRLRTPPPREVYGPYWAIVGERRREPRRGRARPSPIRIGWGPDPSFLSSFLPLPSSPSPTREGGNPTPGGSRTPPGCAIEGRPSPSSTPLYTGEGGTP